MVIVPRVNRKARMHHAVLYPAYKQFRVRLITGETADVVTEVIQPGEAHPQTHAGVVAQSVPASAVIAAPGLHIALHSRAAGAGDQVRTFFRSETLLGFHRGSHHQQWHHRANMFDRDRLTKAVTACFTVPYFEFVVVVPGGVDTHLQKLCGHAFLPPLDGLRISKVEVRTFVIPEAGTFWFICF